MFRQIATIGCLLLVIAFNSNAHESDERVDQLEKELLEIKVRLSKLESLVANTSNTKTKNTSISGDGWRSVMNWRKLSTGMSPSDVRGILGEPNRLNGGTFATWIYQNGGRVIFFDDKVHEWMEPK